MIAVFKVNVFYLNVIVMNKLFLLICSTNLNDAHCWDTILRDLSRIDRAKVVAFKEASADDLYLPEDEPELELYCVALESHLSGVFCEMHVRNFARALKNNYRKNMVDLVRIKFSLMADHIFFKAI